jgi:nicotinate phosphoribosyltransferase
MRRLYRQSLALLTDLYELTMAYGYWKLGRADEDSVFHLFFRSNPFGGRYALACGLGPAVELLRDLRFDASDLEYLERLSLDGASRTFEPDFLDHLAHLRLSCDVDAVEEGTAVFPHEPLLRVRGPLLQAQILESLLLNVLNFQTLIATKAARICAAAGDGAVLEFGLRRAQGIDGGVSASRAAYIGGCTGTSNVLAGKLYDIPVRGTHAHSWVMSFDDELASFEAYAKAMPDNCIFLVDTYDTLEGVQKAIEVGRRLREQGHEMRGIRLDSGDLRELSRRARTMLDEAGFPDAFIVGSGDLDEHRIAELRRAGATIGVWGVGTRLATGFGDPALTGVYKLAAVRRRGDRWHYAVKLSEESAKSSPTGIQQVRRFRSDDAFLLDVIYDVEIGLDDDSQVIDVLEETAAPTDSAEGRNESPPVIRRLPSGAARQDLLVPIFRQGKLVYRLPAVRDIRARAREQQALLPATVRFRSKAEPPAPEEAHRAGRPAGLVDAPTTAHDGEAAGMDTTHYPVLVERRLHELRKTLIQEVDS